MRKPKHKVINCYQGRIKKPKKVHYHTYYVIVDTSYRNEYYLTIGDDFSFNINRARLFDTIIEAWFYRLFRYTLWNKNIYRYQPLKIH